jgi:effector-binding domain-containing protein
MSDLVPDLVTVAPSVAAVEWGHVRFPDIPKFQREARSRIDEALARQGIARIGPHVTFSRRPFSDLIEIAPGVIISGDFQTDGAVMVQDVPAGRAAHLRLEAPYDQLSRAWAHMVAWLEEQALEPTGLNWEVYGDPTVPITDLYALLKAV